MVFSRYLLLACLSMALGFMQPTKYMKRMQHRTNLYSGNGETTSIFDPFAGTAIFTNLAAPPTPKALDEFPSIKLSNFVPVFALVALFGVAGGADATVDSVTVPMKGIELYSRYIICHSRGQ